MKTYPFKRPRAEYFNWSDWLVTRNGTEVSDSDRQPCEGEYLVSISCDIDPEFWREFQLPSIEVVVQAYCGATHFRDQQVVRIENGATDFSAHLKILGVSVFSTVSIETVVTGSLHELPGNPDIQNARLASSPQLAIAFGAAMDGIQTKVMEFGKELWPRIPWRVIASHSTVEDDFASYLVVYVNSELATIGSLESKRGKFEMWRLNVDIMEVAVRQAFSLLSTELGSRFLEDPDIESYLLEIAEGAPTSLWAAVETYAGVANTSGMELLRLASNLESTRLLAEKLMVASGEFYAF